MGLILSGRDGCNQRVFPRHIPARTRPRSRPPLVTGARPQPPATIGDATGAAAARDSPWGVGVGGLAGIRRAGGGGWPAL